MKTKTSKKLSTFRKLSEYATSAEPEMVPVNFKLPLEVMIKIRAVQEAAASPHMGKPTIPEVITGIFMEVCPVAIAEYIKDLEALKLRKAEEEESLQQAG